MKFEIWLGNFFFLLRLWQGEGHAQQATGAQLDARKKDGLKEAVKQTSPITLLVSHTINTGSPLGKCYRFIWRRGAAEEGENCSGNN